MTIKVNLQNYPASTKAIIPMVSLLLLALVGCGTNTIGDSLIVTATASGRPDDYHYAIHFETTKPLAMEPIVEYIKTKNEAGENNVVLTVLKNATESPKSDVRRAKVAMAGERHFEVMLPLEKSDFPVNFFLGRKLLHRVAITPVTEIHVSETEEEQE